MVGVVGSSDSSETLVTPVSSSTGDSFESRNAGCPISSGRSRVGQCSAVGAFRSVYIAQYSILKSRQCPAGPSQGQPRNWQAKDFHDKIEDGCLTCVTAVQTGMGMAFDEGCALYESKQNPSWNKDLDATIKNVERVEQGEDLPEQNPSSSVNMHKVFGEYSYLDVLFLSESQVLKYCGATPKALGLNVEERDAEDGSGQIKGVCPGCPSVQAE